MRFSRLGSKLQSNDGPPLFLQCNGRLSVGRRGDHRKASLRIARKSGRKLQSEAPRKSGSERSGMEQPHATPRQLKNIHLPPPRRPIE